MMPTLETRPHPLVEQFSQLKSLLETFGSKNLQTRREDALRQFEMAGIPTSKDEEFKYTSLRILEETAFGPAYGATVTRHQAEMAPLGKIDAATLTFINGQFAPELGILHALPGGAFIGSLPDALSVLGEDVLGHLGKVASLEGKLGSTNDERFTHLNTAFLADGAVIYVPKNVTLSMPIHLQFLTHADHGPLVNHPRVLIVLEENAEAHVVQTFAGLDGIAFTNVVTEVVLGPGSRLEHVKLQQERSGSVFIATVAVHQEAKSVYHSVNANFGGRIARTDLNVWLNGEYTETRLDGAYLASDEQVMDNHTRIDHAKPNGNSFEVYKGILRDRATGIFNGKIFVYEDAQKTDAKQTNQALLLSPTATIYTKPQLEIFADDVKCTHGATIGQLREEALFYLRARGIPLAEAKALLVYAFVAEVLEKITMDDVRKGLESILYANLGMAESS